MKKDVVIRPANVEEIQELAAIFAEVFPLDARTQMGSDAVMAYLGNLASHDAYCVLVAICGMAIAGFAMLHIDRSRSLGWRWVLPYWRRLLGYVVSHPRSAATFLIWKLEGFQTWVMNLFWKKPVPITHDLRKSCQLDWIGVAPAFRGEGIGERLMVTSASLTKSARRSTLELVVEADNVPAIRLYEKVGFRQKSYDRRRKKLTYAADAYSFSASPG